MLEELHVRDLGVIEELALVLHPGLTAITGETGAGKTLVVEALGLLLGGRADPTMVREGASEAFVEARLVVDDGDGPSERIVARALAAEGRSRAYVDGRMAGVALLGEASSSSIELYAQHAHQSLFQRAHQREALDRFAGVDLTEVRSARARLVELSGAIDALGGDAQQRAREQDLVAFELAEIDAARISGADEEAGLATEEDMLANVVARRDALGAAHEAISEEEAGVLARLGTARRALSDAGVPGEIAARLAALEAETADLQGELRAELESLEEDPERLAAVRERRQLLRSLMRKYGETLGVVLETRDQLAERLSDLEASDEHRVALEAERAALAEALGRAEEIVGDTRRKAAPGLARAVEGHLGALGLGRARIEIAVPPTGIGDEVEFLLAANTGEPPLPLARVASGGELARTMLALRLVLTAAPPTLVFDEVDAGIGGEAALAVGRALAALAEHHQVIVVTHLAQVAAFAQHQIVVEKREHAGRTNASAHAVSGEGRVVELSRMLSGHPDSQAARAHAAELLASAGVTSSS